MPGYSGYDSTRSKAVSARTRSTSNSGTKTARSPRRVGDDGDRPLGREEVEAGEVADVVVAEEGVAGQPVAADVLEQALASCLQLCCGDARRRIHGVAKSLRRAARRASFPPLGDGEIAAIDKG